VHRVAGHALVKGQGWMRWVYQAAICSGQRDLGVGLVRGAVDAISNLSRTSKNGYFTGALF
jgi:hypothetical protein